MSDLFFELIQISIGVRDKCTHILSVTEWIDLYLMSQKFALVGVCFNGV
jgi:hypothetical protein